MNPMKEITTAGCCKYCGQMVTLNIPADKEYTEADLDTIASTRCDCQVAAETKRREDRLNEAYKSIDEIFPEIEPVRNLMKQAAELISREEIDNISVKIDEVTSAKIKMTTKGKIRIERIRKNSAVKES